MKTIKAGSGERGETGEEGKARLLDGVDSRHWDGDPHAEEPGVWHTPGLALWGLGGQSPTSRAEEHGVSPEMGAGTSPAVWGALMRSLGFRGGRGEDTRAL